MKMGEYILATPCRITAYLLTRLTLVTLHILPSFRFHYILFLPCNWYKSALSQIAISLTNFFNISYELGYYIAYIRISNSSAKTRIYWTLQLRDSKQNNNGVQSGVRIIDVMSVQRTEKLYSSGVEDM